MSDEMVVIDGVKPSAIEFLGVWERKEKITNHGYAIILNPSVKTTKGVLVRLRACVCVEGKFCIPKLSHKDLLPRATFLRMFFFTGEFFPHARLGEKDKIVYPAKQEKKIE